MYFHVFRIHLPHQKRSLATPKTTFHQLNMHRFTVLPVNLVVATIHQHLEILLAYFQLASDHLYIRPAFFWHPPKECCKTKNNSGKLGKIPTKSRTSQPAIKNVWLRFWYVLISVFFILNHGQVCHFWRYFCALFYDLWGAVIPKKGHTCQLKTTPTRTLQSLHMSYYNISFVYLLSFHYICGYKYTEYSVYS